MFQRNRSEKVTNARNVIRSFRQDFSEVDLAIFVGSVTAPTGAQEVAPHKRAAQGISRQLIGWSRPPACQKGVAQVGSPAPYKRGSFV